MYIINIHKYFDLKPININIINYEYKSKFYNFNESYNNNK